MKKIIPIVLTITILLTAAACSKTADEGSTTAADTTASTQAAESTSENTTTTTTTTTTTAESTETTTTTTTSTTKKETSTKKKETSTKAFSGDAFALSYKGVSIKPNDDMKKVVKKIGKPSSKPMKSPSCMEGAIYDLVYTYSDFEIETFCDKKGNETILSIGITGKKVATGNGIKVGDKTKDAIKKSGLKFQDDGGYYICTKGNISIELEDEGGKITSISIYLELNQ